MLQTLSNPFTSALVKTKTAIEQGAFADGIGIRIAKIKAGQRNCPA